MEKKKMLTYRGAVATWECDSNGHMNVMYYINKYELAGRNLFAQVGLRKDYMKANDFGIAVLEQNIKYLREVFEDDVLYIESYVTEVSNKVITVFHELKNGVTDELCGTASIKLVILDKIKRKAVVIPEEIRKNLI